MAARFKAFCEDWNEYLHPRNPKGSKEGGRFTRKVKRVDPNYYGRWVEEVPIKFLKSIQGNELGKTNIEELMKDIEENGLKEPVIILVGKESRTVKLGEGNHRVEALKRLGYKTVPARVIVGREWGKTDGRLMDGNLKPKRKEYFTSDAAPSEVFHTLGEDWNEYLHPRVPKGKKGGGQFAHKYIHYSDEPLSKLKDVPIKDQSENGMKPRGIWFSIGSAWKDWSDFEYKNASTDVQNMFPTNQETVLVLKKDAKILRISTAKQLDRFTEKYPGEDEYLDDSMMNRQGTPMPGQMINWQKVAQDYDGIIIAPYIGSRRLTNHTMWYYGWDVASGCIWNIDAIRMLK